MRPSATSEPVHRAQAAGLVTRAEDPIVITSLGMVSSLGLDVVTGCAAARAGLQRLHELELTVADQDALVSVPLMGHSAAWHTSGFEGFGRWFRLGDAALNDLLAYAPLEPAHTSRLGIVLHLPDHLYDDALLKGQLADLPNEDVRSRVREALITERVEVRNEITRRLLPELLAAHGLTIPAGAQAYSFGGAASFVRALEIASEWLQRRVVERCIVGGIDSNVDDAALTCLYELGLLKTQAMPVGGVAGEAAAFVLLERLDSARSRGARIEALLGAASAANEDGNRFSGAAPTGVALSRAAASCLAAPSVRSREPGLMIANLTGDELRARDFAGALVRMKASGLNPPGHRWYVGEHVGEIGAATGPVAICLGVRGFVRRYASSPSALIMLLDDDDARGAILIHEADPSADHGV